MILYDFIWFYIPLIRIPIMGWMTVPRIRFSHIPSFDHGTHGLRFVDSGSIHRFSSHVSHETPDEVRVFPEAHTRSPSLGALYYCWNFLLLLLCGQIISRNSIESLFRPSFLLWSLCLTIALPKTLRRHGSVALIFPQKSPSQRPVLVWSISTT